MPHPAEHGDADRPLGADEPAAIAASMKVFGTESRVRILFALLGDERTVDQLADEIQMDSSAVSQQLRVLRQQQFVVGRREGRHIHYRLHNHHIADLLAAVRHHHEHAAHGWASAEPAPAVERSS